LERRRPEFKKWSYYPAWANIAQLGFKILEKYIVDLFRVTEVNIDLPSKAKIEPSKPCERCGEPTMITKLTNIVFLDIFSYDVKWTALRPLLRFFW
jgi:hypothetical protein